ncbi:MAG: hypothetical protein A3A24_00280 [Candidatus Buchananbacteria bacterium RIFCSPLOWO2_01_FULL_46_12]|uniref:Uncharacterized protein n=1 Tax=Candidatus Buchananbacteria bacterium RIFCSPLOWO2_01_FULL_46_12 TaxID=1797546 RepID=A0A1G1YP20_9BACT|nr:MAG: hypothetical protein A3A24_00280 [Candidatus Buchananbacteria bacterium RIFCSPLOWO2_01_FULL_46_12]
MANAHDVRVIWLRCHESAGGKVDTILSVILPAATIGGHNPNAKQAAMTSMSLPPAIFFQKKEACGTGPQSETFS